MTNATVMERIFPLCYKNKKLRIAIFISLAYVVFVLILNLYLWMKGFVMGRTTIGFYLWSWGMLLVALCFIVVGIVVRKR